MTCHDQLRSDILFSVQKIMLDLYIDHMIMFILAILIEYKMFPCLI